MKRIRKRLQLNLDTLRILQPAPLASDELAQVVGGNGKSATGAKTCCDGGGGYDGGG